MDDILLSQIREREEITKSLVTSCEGNIYCCFGGFNPEFITELS